MKSRLLGLDALRGAAALLVLWMHLHLSHHVSIYPPRGHLAVDFFFMLSGYVMARTYEGHMRGGVWFLRKRIRRLWPTVAAGSLFGLALIWRTGGDWPLVAALNLLLIPAVRRRCVPAQYADMVDLLRARRQCRPRWMAPQMAEWPSDGARCHCWSS
jgi:peptidoglycan/LPS O-acetylase OafA/YrhL